MRAQGEAALTRGKGRRGTLARGGPRGDAMGRVGMGVLLAAAVALAGAAEAAGRKDERLAQPIARGALDLRLFDEAVVGFANDERRARGIGPLARDRRLFAAATGHAANMARLATHSHRLPITGEGRLVQRMDRNGVRYRTAGENIGMEKVLRLLGRPIAMGAEGCAYTYADDGAPVPRHSYATLARSAVARWMASPKHRASLLSAGFRRTGVGVAIDPEGPACGDVYLVQTFAD
jgi:uncharacterized protein YkwD